MDNLILFFLLLYSKPSKTDNYEKKNIITDGLSSFFLLLEHQRTD